MAHILILGGGFGGLIAAEELRDLLGESTEHRITLVSSGDKFVFYPALVRLAFGECGLDEITFDLSEKSDELNVHFVQGKVSVINLEEKSVQIESANQTGSISYDYLIIATGRRLATQKIDGYFEHAHHLLGVKAALKFSEAVRSFKSGSIIVGMAEGACLPIPVCETAFALAKRFAPEINNREISISIVFPESLEEAFGGADLHRELERDFAKHNINLITDFAARKITDESITSESGQSINYDLLMLIPPFCGQPILAGKGITDESDFIEVDTLMRVLNAEKVYAVGDITSLNGPKLAFMAIRQGQVAAENIAAELRGEVPHKIYYHDLAVIIDEGGTDSIFLHYGIWDNTLYGIKEGKMWNRMKEQHNQLWEAVR